MPRIFIEGWRFLAHSYALVNAFQCLELLRRPDVSLYHHDLPLPHADWKTAAGVLDADRERLLASIPVPPADLLPDAVYRIGFPYDLSGSRAKRTAVFGTVQSAVRASYLVGGVSLRQAMSRSDVILITPSRWSKDRFIDAGADPARVHVVPHGVDPAIFHPLPPAQRQAARKSAGCEGHFVFLHIGAMTENKNIAMLLRAFAEVARRHSHARLALKGLDPLYGSVRLLQEAAGGLSQSELSIVQPRLGYWGGVWPMSKLARMYQTADAYVSPYSAEGFNLPVLEAAAVGLPVICTAGGPTDDFTTADFALPIASQKVALDGPEPGAELVPDFESLLRQMRRAIEEPHVAQKAAVAGPVFVNARFTWPIVIDQLLAVLV